MLGGAGGAVMAGICAVNCVATVRRPSPSGSAWLVLGRGLVALLASLGVGEQVLQHLTCYNLA